jgi:hypothetical protein
MYIRLAVTSLTGDASRLSFALLTADYRRLELAGKRSDQVAP